MRREPAVASAGSLSWAQPLAARHGMAARLACLLGRRPDCRRGCCRRVAGRAGTGRCGARDRSAARGAGVTGGMARGRHLLTARPRGPLAREALLCAGAAAVMASALAWLGPPGTDFAAHAYQRTLFLEHGFTLWNNFWYAGRYSFVTYSVLYYPLAAVLGIRLLAVATIALAAFAFAIVLWREWGAETRWSSRTFAVVWAGIVLSAAFPFALGMAFALLALGALQAHARWRF